MQALLDTIASIEIGHDVQRLFHGRGGRFENCDNLNLDWYPDVFLLTSFEALAFQELEAIRDALEQRLLQLDSSRILNLVFQHRQSGQAAQSTLICGAVPEPHWVSELGIAFQVHLLKGQNHGLFLDMRQGRAWVQEHSADKNVLNMFAYTGGFSMAALKGQARQVVNIDMSKGALNIAKRNHQYNQLDHGVRYLSHDIFKSWGKLKKLGPYELLIADPPSNQRGSFVATKDYSRLLKRLPDLLSDQADVLLCLNAPELSRDYLKSQVSEYCPQLEFLEQVANPSVFDDINPERALKVLRYRYNKLIEG
ncbi:SAM-dependent methyltransferase [Alginatibacterium sediminis]|uniref:SAM-dependent methyltransferase n=1 Tax=Alginatibacterium sediminis TaxID=2164068 RepID=A0A420ECW3_9ALTE|nr:class I SAM-dependent methyltransferase [Alginatibacterium sediminis]RKF18494.1 SAM-dependent methyltransferase [Alginatibacterium sediminis]